MRADLKSFLGACVLTGAAACQHPDASAPVAGAALVAQMAPITSASYGQRSASAHGDMPTRRGEAGVELSAQAAAEQMIKQGDRTRPIEIPAGTGFDHEVAHTPGAAIALQEAGAEGVAATAQTGTGALEPPATDLRDRVTTQPLEELVRSTLTLGPSRIPALRVHTSGTGPAGRLTTGDIQVTAKDGIVRLQGDVASERQMDAIVGRVQRIEGVRGVDNQMTVAAPSDTPAILPGEPDLDKE
jgi:hypothetical protein